MNEADSVQWVVDEILDQLVYNKTKPEEKLVNIDALIRDVNSLFFKEEDVRVVGIWGMGGSGKTTIARAFFDRYSSQFKHKVFLANIREVTQKDGAEHLQSNLISEILKSKSIRVKDVCEGANMIKDRLCKKKVLLILDDVDNKYELDALAGSTSWFGKGSKVIITTRNRKLLTKPEVDETYVVNLLPDGEALQLFSLHAFNQAIPAEGFEELSQEVIDYAKGLPLALKVWGSFLYNRDVLEWKSTIERLNIIPEEGISEDAIVETLKISYDGLKDSWLKEMFLDIVCFFRWWRECEVKEILDRFYSNSAIGLSILKERSLIYISCGVIEIHDLIEEMGHRIVRETHRDEPWKHSRLWKEAEISNVLMGCMDKGNIQAICLEYFFPEHMEFSGDRAFTGMHRLRLLRIFGGKFPRGLEYLPSELKSLYWSGYPLESLPKDFLGRKLVALEMPYGKVSRLWEGVKCCLNLEIIDLSHCQKLVETPDLKMIPHLKKLILRNCRSLREVHHSVEFLNELRLLDLESCQNLVHLPGCIWRLINSKVLDLSHFSMLKNLPEVLGKMDCLWILEKLKLVGCYQLAILPRNIWRLKHLEIFDIRHCLKLKKLPEIPEKMDRLLKLKLDRSGVRELPSSVKHLSGLKYLGLEGCRNLATLPTNIWTLKRLEILNLSECSRLEKLPEILETLDCLKHLMLNNSGIRELPSSIYHLRGLICLDLTLCENLAILPKGTWRLMSLKFLYLSQCSKLEKLPEIGDDIAYSSVLEILDLSSNENLVSLPRTIGRLTNLKILKVSGCLEIKTVPEGLGDLDQLEELHADDTAIQYLPSSITRLNTLEFLSLRKKLFIHRQVSSSFVFPLVSTGFRSLVSLDLSNCSLIEGGLPCTLECLSSLISLNLSGNNFLFLPDISRLCCLRFLDLTFCSRLHGLPELPPRIKELYADARLALMSIPKISSKYKDLDVVSFIDEAERDVSIYQENQSGTCKRHQPHKELIQFSAHLEGMFNVLHKRNTFSIAFPGCEIPVLFNYQERGAYGISIKLPSDWFSERFLGFSICCVDEFRSLERSDGYSDFEYQCVNSSYETIIAKLIPLDGEPEQQILESRCVAATTYTNIKSSHVSSVFMPFDFPSIDVDNSKFYCLLEVSGESRIRTHWGVRLLYENEIKEWESLWRLPVNIWHKMKIWHLSADTLPVGSLINQKHYEESSMSRSRGFEWYRMKIWRIASATLLEGSLQKQEVWKEMSLSEDARNGSKQLRGPATSPATLRKYQIFPKNGICLFCHLVEENIVHLFFHCRIARPVWLKTWGIRTEEFLELTTQQWIHVILNPEKLFGLFAPSRNQFVVFAAIMFRKIWEKRNHMLQGEDNRLNADELYRAGNEATEEEKFIDRFLSDLLETKFDTCETDRSPEPDDIEEYDLYEDDDDGDIDDLYDDDGDIELDHINDVEYHSFTF
ncbi:disease resistance protein Roq1-like isoform X2 [Lycium barbarum]|uniref:disease resistance protein Roq1-like isoform X2 n=1 Tax=Lycium barbarum TaxID=112863 RepID=UPI00293E7398|nr:disease resistance protein Roq1-like isoform X2 [Lycium barbarum]